MESAANLLKKKLLTEAITNKIRLNKFHTDEQVEKNFNFQAYLFKLPFIMACPIHDRQRRYLINGKKEQL